MKTIFTLSAFVLSSSAFASVCVIAPPMPDASDDGVYIVETCDGLQIPTDMAIGPWPDYLVQATKLMNQLEAQGYKIVSQSGEAGATTWTLAK